VNISGSRHHGAVEQLTDAGLGLDYEKLRLDRTTETWISAGAHLRDQVAELLGDVDASVEQIGSSSVLGLLAKPVIDLAVGLAAHHEFALVSSTLEAHGWIYRGDAGDNGGQVFVLEARPWHRVAHIHVVDFGKTQWVNYLRLRDLLRGSPEARSRYEAAKLQLADEHGDDRKAYTDGKSAVVTLLLGDIN
jgi:GrpB-like predicted nucleotidyltransferase (UPF0157 family)